MFSRRSTFFGDLSVLPFQADSHVPDHVDGRVAASHHDPLPDHHRLRRHLRYGPERRTRRLFFFFRSHPVHVPRGEGTRRLELDVADGDSIEGSSPVVLLCAVREGGPPVCTTTALLVATRPSYNSASRLL